MTDHPPNTFVDLSSNNAAPDLGKYAHAGHRIVGLKATESTDYTWSEHGRLADTAHRENLHVLHYHFARPGNPTAQAEAFLRAVASHIKPGDGLVIDCEVSGVTGSFVTTWIAHVHSQHPNIELWVYGSPYFLDDAGIRPSHKAKLWLADYTTAPKPVKIPRGWKTYDAWQFTASGTVAGVSGHVDVSRLRVTAKPKPPPKPKRRPTNSRLYRAWLRWLNFWHRRASK